MRFYKILLLSLLFIPFSGFGGVYIHEGESNVKIPYEEFELFVDTSGSFNIADVIKHKDYFRINHGKTIHQNDVDNWLTFDIYNQSKSESFILEFFDPHINELEVFVIEKDSVIDFHYDTEGHSIDFDQKIIKHKNHAFDITMHSDNVYTFFIRINSGSESSLSSRISTTRFFTNYALGEYFYLGMFYGIIFIMVIYHIFIYTSNDEKNYLYFVFYLIAGALITFYEDGLGFQFIWPHLPGFNAWMPYFFRLLLPFAFYLYYSELIELRSNFPTLRKALLILVCVIIGVELLLVILEASTRFYLFALLFLFAVTFISSLYLILNLKYKPAYYLLLGNSILFANFLMMLLRTYKVIPSTIFTVYAFNFSFVIEAVIFAVAIGEKMRESKDVEISVLKEAKSSKDRINKKLEDLVEERTSKVIEQNTTLEEYNTHLVNSLNYAKRIQETISPSVGQLKRSFNDFSIINIPVNVINSHFYWFYEITSEEVILCIGDSEGNGVPGGFMSMIAHTELNTIIKEQQVYNPSQVLGILNKKMYDLLHANDAGAVSYNEKLSMTVCRINKSYKQLDIAQANRNVYLLLNDEVDEVVGTSSSIGTLESQDVIYETTHRSYQHNELLYLGGEGFENQVGGAIGDTFGIPRLKDKLLSINKLSLNIQEELLMSEFQNWKGNNKQADDVLLLALRF